MTADIVTANLHLGHGVAPAEFDHIVHVFGRLDHHLRSFDDRTIELRLHVKERDTASQHTTLEAHVPGHSTLIATSNATEFEAALAEVRDEMVRQLTHLKTLAEPRHNRALREH